MDQTSDKKTDLQETDTPDTEFLGLILKYRMLSDALLWKILSKKGYESKEEVRRKALYLTDLGKLEEATDSEGNRIYQLTDAGIAQLREAGRDLSFSAEDLRLEPVLFSHQLHLNDFVLDFEEAFQKVTPFRYYDLKQLPAKSPNLLPDGMIECRECFLFFEMDLGTEHAGDLEEKWGSYQAFFKEHAPYYQKPVILLFILSGSVYTAARRHTVAKTAFPRLGELFGRNLEIYADRPERLTGVLKTRFETLFFGNRGEEKKLLEAHKELRILREKDSFFDAEALHRGTYEVLLTLPAGQKNPEGTETVVMDVEFWLDDRLSPLQMISRHAEYTAGTLGELPVPLLFVVPDSNHLQKELNPVDCRIGIYVYFIGLKEFQSDRWTEKIVQLKGPVGNRWIFRVKDFFQRVSAPL